MSNSIEELIDNMPKDRTVNTIEQAGMRMLTREEVNKIPMNIVINNFKMKDVILSVLKEYHFAGWFNDDNYLEESELTEIAEAIEKEFAKKMNLLQG